MSECVRCGQRLVDRLDPPRYDVLAPGFSPDGGAPPGPYCEACWPNTTTGALEHDRMTAEKETT